MLCGFEEIIYSKHSKVQIISILQLELAAGLISFDTVTANFIEKVQVPRIFDNYFLKTFLPVYKVVYKRNCVPATEPAWRRPGLAT